MRAYYGSRISPNMTKTPEGFLICHNVPIARIGWQDYLGQEIGLSDEQVVHVYRPEEQVFHPAAVASFEGKSVTDEHPPDAVRPDNYSSYEKGHVRNVRRGVNADPDFLIADLFLKDPKLISEVTNNNKREVSCGYDCQYEPMGDGQYRQIGIRGNHVAVVASGRAGDRITINDAMPKKSRSERRMKVDKDTLFGRMLSAFAKDADPEEMAEAARMAPGGDEPATPPALEHGPDEEGGDDMHELVMQLVEAVSDLSDKVEALMGSGEPEPEPAEPGLDALIGKLEKPDGEAAMTVEPDQIHDGDAGPIAPEGLLPDNPITDRKSFVLDVLKDMRSVVADIPDPKIRKMVSDRMVQRFKQETAGSQPNGYAALQAAKVASTKDQKATQDDLSELGRDWAKQYNPHLREKKEVK